MIKLINFQYKGSITNGSKINYKYLFSFYTIYNERVDLKSGDFTEHIGDIAKIIKMKNEKVVVDEIFLANKNHIINFFNSDYKQEATKEQKEELIKLLKNEGIDLENIEKRKNDTTTLQDLKTANNILKFIKKSLKSSNDPIAKFIYFVISFFENKIKMAIFISIGGAILAIIVSIITTIFW